MIGEFNIYEGPALGVSQNPVNDESHILLSRLGRQKRGKRKKQREAPKEKGDRKVGKVSRQTNGNSISDVDGDSQYIPPVLITEELRQFIESFDHKPMPNLDLSHKHLKKIPLLFAQPTTEIILSANVSHNSLRDLPHALHFPNLQELDLSVNNFQSFELKFAFPHLTHLDLSSNKMGKFPSPEALDFLPALRTLNLYDNILNAIPTRSFEKLTKLESLNLSYNKLTSIPKEISALCSLRILLLDKNNLRELPDSITQLNLEDSTFEISGNRLSYPPQEVADRGFSAVKRYMQLLLQEQQSRLADFSVTSAPPTSPIPMSSLPIPLNTPVPKKRKSFRVNDEVSHDPTSEQPTKSSQYKLIVVGREGAGKTSTIRFLTRNIVQVTGGTHEEEEFSHPRYGKLIDVYDSDRYIVRLFPENSETICRAEHLRLATSVDADIFDYDSIGPPHSTIGIDIDVWKPAITYSLLQSQNTAPSSQVVEAQKSVTSLPTHGLKSYASALLSHPAESGSKISQNSSMKRDLPNLSRISLPISEGFGIYEARPEGYSSGAETHGPGSKPSSYRKGARGLKSDLLKSEKRQTFEGKPPVDLTLSIWSISLSLPCIDLHSRDFAGQDIYHSAHEVSLLLPLDSILSGILFASSTVSCGLGYDTKYTQTF
jgi:Leucine-rich repeat (LRR) protein